MIPCQLSLPALWVSAVRRSSWHLADEASGLRLLPPSLAAPGILADVDISHMRGPLCPPDDALVSAGDFSWAGLPVWWGSGGDDGKVDQQERDLLRRGWSAAAERRKRSETDRERQSTAGVSHRSLICSSASSITRGRDRRPCSSRPTPAPGQVSFQVVALRLCRLHSKSRAVVALETT